MILLSEFRFGDFGRKQSPETRRKISRSLKGRKKGSGRSLKDAETRSKVFRNYVSPTTAAVREARGTARLLMDLSQLGQKPASRRQRRDTLSTALGVKALLR